ncbi:MAG TPA: FAD-binding protein [Capillimicrobium sp.]|nr:FAD-binding protein [Capillimicrobium sp.]
MTALDIITTISATSVDALRRRVEGPVFGPEDEGWDAARAAWNLAVDQQPTAVVVPHSADDVVAAVRVARAHGLRVTAQVTGHNASAYASLDDTILLRMTELRDVEIDAAGRRARAGAGCEWRDVVMPASEHGLAALAGSSPQVSVVGYALGGGIGWLARRHGLAAGRVTLGRVAAPRGRGAPPHVPGSSRRSWRNAGVSASNSESNTGRSSA